MDRDALSNTFAALADPTRRAILVRLAEGEATVMELAAPFSMSMPAISRHLKVLETAGLLQQGRQAQWRPCRLDSARLREVSEWLESFRRHWVERSDPLDDFLKKLKAHERS